VSPLAWKQGAAVTVLGLVGMAAASGCNAISGVGDYAFGAGGATTTTTTATGTAGSGGSAGTGGATGGTGGGSSTGGAGAGEGGAGAGEPTLTDRGLVMRYYVDEAGSGQGPTQLFDAAPSPLDLSLTYSAELSFATIFGHRGLRWTNHDLAGDARVAITGTKVQTMLQGSTTATIEVVTSVEDVSTSSCHFTTLGPGGHPGDLSLFTISDTSVRLVWNGATDIGTWNVPISGLGRVVLHAVIDTTESTAAARTQLYVDTVAATKTSGATPDQNSTVDISASTTFVVGNGISATNLSIGGTIFYVAYYASALSETEIATNAELLTASDDSPP
jgi:hypothetical protein